MTTAAEVEAFFEGMRVRLSSMDPVTRARLPHRSLLATCPDLDLAYRTDLVDGALTPATACRADEAADVVFEFQPGDLRHLVDGTLDLREAWQGGRLRVRANPLDLLRLRALR